MLIGADEIERRVAELGEQISERYAGSSLVLIGVLTGAVVFLVDLMRRITVPTEIDFLAVSSYGHRTVSGELRVLKNIDLDISGRNVIIVEDIVDTGRTLNAVCAMLRVRQPGSLETCVMLDKPSRREVSVPVEYRAFTIPDRFVVGYGLDWAGHYRNLDYIGVVET